MTHLRLALPAFILFALTSCGGSSHSDEQKSETAKLAIETPPLEKETVSLGKIKMNQEGNSVGKKTELTELYKLVQDESIDVIEINWVWDTQPVYDDKDMRITYDKINGDLTLVYMKTNVREEFTNISVDCLSDFLKNKEKSFYSIERYCKDSNYDFNNREMTQRTVGEKPKQSEVDGSVSIIENFVKSNANDASSIDFLEWSKVSAVGEFWVARAKYKGTNAFGGVVTEDMWFYIQNGTVVKTKPIN